MGVPGFQVSYMMAVCVHANECASSEDVASECD